MNKKLLLWSIYIATIMCLNSCDNENSDSNKNAESTESSITIDTSIIQTPESESIAVKGMKVYDLGTEYHYDELSFAYDDLGRIISSTHTCYDKGNIESTYTNNVSYKDNEIIITNEYSIDTYTISEDGYITIHSFVSKESPDEVNWSETYTYNENNEPILIEVDSEYSSTLEYKWDCNNIISSEASSEGGLEVVNYEYNASLKNNYAIDIFNFLLDRDITVTSLPLGRNMRSQQLIENSTELYGSYEEEGEELEKLGTTSYTYEVDESGRVTTITMKVNSENGRPEAQRTRIAEIAY